jgi:hypothetical protein
VTVALTPAIGETKVRDRAGVDIPASPATSAVSAGVAVPLAIVTFASPILDAVGDRCSSVPAGIMTCR